MWWHNPHLQWTHQNRSQKTGNPASSCGVGDQLSNPPTSLFVSKTVYYQTNQQSAGNLALLSASTPHNHQTQHRVVDYNSFWSIVFDSLSRKCWAHRVYSIYYNGTLVLPYRRGGRLEAGRLVGLRVSCGSRTRDVVISAMDTWAIYTSLDEWRSQL